MRIIRFAEENSPRLAAVTDDEAAFPLPDGDFIGLIRRAEASGCTPAELVRREIAGAERLSSDWRQLPLLAPLEAPEVWAAGVTYLRSKEARNFESKDSRNSITCYDKVYDAERPELFVKSTAARTVGPGGEVSLRSDSNWQVPEPELALVLDHDGRILGYTIGNDMSCRDIEGENPLYLPQAKIWRNSCSIGPAVRLAETVENPYDLTIRCRIIRGGSAVFDESANTGQLKRKLEELAAYLKRDNVLFEGTVLLTGTCIVPPDDFTLAPGDVIEIDITGIGTLVNPVGPASFS